MSDIGKPVRRITVIPLREPVPTREDEPTLPKPRQRTPERPKEPVR